MVTDAPAPDGPSVFATMAEERRRLVVVVLHEQPRPLPVDDLASFVAARETGSHPKRVPDETRRRVELSLHHVHLPNLVAAGLIRQEDGAVALASNPTADLAVDLALASSGSTVDSPGDEVFEVLGHRQRLAAVAVLQSAGEPWRLADLADRVAAAVGPGVSADRAAVSLDHLHLPQLAEAGIVTYDRDDQRVTFDGLPGPFERMLAEVDPAKKSSTGGPSTCGDSLSTFL